MVDAGLCNAITNDLAVSISIFLCSLPNGHGASTSLDKLDSLLSSEFGLMITSFVDDLLICKFPSCQCYGALTYVTSTVL